MSYWLKIDVLSFRGKTAENSLLWLITVTLLSIVLVYSSFKHASARIILENGYELQFENGVFDTETRNMGVNRVEIFENGKRGWYANRLMVDTILLGDGLTMIAKSIQMDGFVSAIDNTRVGIIIARNCKLNKQVDLLEGKF